MKRALKALLILVVLQSVLLAGYLATQHEAETLDAELEDRASPELVYLHRDGTEGSLSSLRGQPVLLHFWATWCPPCRTELPSLLSLAEQERVTVLAVSLDTSWNDVQSFFEGPPPRSVVLAKTATASDAFRVPRLPETLLIDSSGRIKLRFAGERDWGAPGIRNSLEEATSLTR